MADPTQDAMLAAGFVQAPTTGGFVQPASVPVQAPVVSGNNDTVNTISSIIQDNSGGLSSIRILMLLWGVGVFLIWAAAWIVGMCHGIYTAPSIPAEVITILLGVSGVKCVQRFGEK